jgi:PKD repeat protein
VSFSGSVADATSWTISFGDGSSVSGTGSSVSATHTYAAPGTYVATLTATSAEGSDSQGTTVDVA